MMQVGATVRKSRMKQAQERVLDTGMRLFREFGYANTTIDMIAEAAGVGVSTVYKYFGSKPGLVREMWRKRLEIFTKLGGEVIANAKAEPVDAIVDLLNAYKIDGVLLQRDILLEGANQDLGYSPEFQGVREQVDALIIGQLSTLLTTLAQRGAINPFLDRTEIAHIIYAQLNERFQYYLTHSASDFDTEWDRLAKRVRMLFEPWRVHQPKTGH
jgi:AcrR family transcriptional regulator